MISYDYYKVFYYVCKYKNFTRAANVLMTSQSSVSHTISNLEHQLGCRLFQRNNHGIELTSEGKRLYQYVSIGCEQFLKGENEIMNAVSLESGSIYLGATETALHCYLFKALDRFHSIYPNVKLKINNYSTKDAIEALKNGIVDLTVTATPFDTAPKLKTIILKNIQDILIGGTMYQELENTTLSLKDLMNYPLISYTSGSKSRTFLEECFAHHHLILSPMIESAASDLIIPMAKHNLGLAFIPEDMAHDAIVSGELIQIPLEETLPSRQICLIYDTHNPRSTASNELIRFLIEGEI